MSQRAAGGSGVRVIPIEQAVGTVIAHDLTEIRPGVAKGPAFRRGHVVRVEDLPRLRCCGKEHLYVLEVGEDQLHEDDAARALAAGLCGPGTAPAGGPREGRVNLAASWDGLLRVDREKLLAFNLVGTVVCATLRSGAVVRAGEAVAGTRAIPLLAPRRDVEEALAIASGGGTAGIVEVRRMRRPRVGAVVTGAEIARGLTPDAFAPVIRRKAAAFGGEVVGIRFVPDDEEQIVRSLQGLLAAGADFLLATGGMSVDADDRTPRALARLAGGAVSYGAPVLPGSMLLVGRVDTPGGAVPLVGVPACALFREATAFDLVFPRLLAGEGLGRRELAELGHGGLCLACGECRFPVCPFGRS